MVCLGVDRLSGVVGGDKSVCVFGGVFDGLVWVIQVVVEICIDVVGGKVIGEVFGCDVIDGKYWYVSGQYGFECVDIIGFEIVGWEDFQCLCVCVQCGKSFGGSYVVDVGDEVGVYGSMNYWCMCVGCDDQFVVCCDYQVNVFGVQYGVCVDQCVVVKGMCGKLYVLCLVG